MTIGARRGRTTNRHVGMVRAGVSATAAVAAILASTTVALGADGSASGTGTDPVAGDPLLPYVVALLVAGVTLLVVGALVLVTGRRAPAKASRTRAGTGWWTCAACGADNAPDRPDCYACMAHRGGGSGPTAGDEQAGPADR